jgi:uncharacterized OB-fold protein
MTGTLESFTVIRVGMPGAPYVVAVVRTDAGLTTARLDVDVDRLPAIGTALRDVSGAGIPTYAVAEEVPA